MMKKASALLCDECRMYTTESQMTENWAFRMRSIESELPKGTQLTKFVSKRAQTWFESNLNKERGAIKLVDVSSDKNKKIITHNITLQYDPLARTSELPADIT